MRLFGVFGGFLALVVTFPALGQDGKFKSGPQPAAPGEKPKKMPHSFEVHTFNGKNADRFHCLVCENDIHPTVMLFLKEPAEGKGKALEDLLKKLDELIDKYQVMEKYPEVTTLAAYAVFIDPAAQTALTKPDEADPAALVKEATDRRALYAHMKEWAGKTKKVIVGVTVPEWLDKRPDQRSEGYKINPAASLTGLYYDGLSVLENFSYENFTEADVDPIIRKVEARLQDFIADLEARKKKPAKNRT